MNDRETQEKEFRILIAEDDPANQRALEGYLRRLGHCDVVENGEIALAHIEQAWEDETPYDLVCMDIHMPILSGMDALLEIRKREAERGILGLSGTRIMMITTEDLSKSILSAFKAGCEAYHVKPICEEKLFQELSKLGIS